MKTILVFLCALVLVACCQRSEAGWDGGVKKMLSYYPAKGTECAFKADIAMQVAENGRKGNHMSTYDIQTQYNFGAMDPEVVAVLMTFALQYETSWLFPNQVRKEVLQKCGAKQL